MADFYQTPYISTLHNLRNSAVEEIEAQLVNFSSTRPLGLILPSLYSELETPAMPNIREELKKVPYLSQIVVGLDRADEDDFASALKFFFRTTSTASCHVARRPSLASHSFGAGNQRPSAA
jgi:glucosyl-3-phosphoglycerate synthase